MRATFLVPALLAGALAALPAGATTDRPLTAEEFDALTRGRTLDTSTGLGIYGVETFLSGRRVIWKDAEKCVQGTWRPSGQDICFDYDGADGPVCWQYFDRGEAIEGWFSGEGPTSEPIFLTESAEGPVSCGGWIGA